jgi:uncharacterized membrane protein (UPF0136 family)
MRVRHHVAGSAGSALTRDQDMALRQLSSEGVLTAEQAAAVRAALGRVGVGLPVAPLTHRLAEVLGYLGGGLMLGGAALLVATAWQELSLPARTVLLLTVSAALVVAGMVIAGGPRALRAPGAHPARLRVTEVLFALAAGTCALTAGTVATSNQVLWAAAVGLGVAVAGYLVVPSVPGVVAAAVLSTITVHQVVLDVIGADARGLAAAYVLLGLVWGALAAAGVIAQPWAGFSAGATIALMGAQHPVGNPEWAGWAYALTAAVALTCFLAYLRARSPVLLVAGIVGITIAVPEAIWDWTNGAVGGAAIALVAGAVLLVASWASMRFVTETGDRCGTSGSFRDPGRRP